MTVLAKSTIQKGFDDNLQTAITLLPKIGSFLLILIIGIIVAKIVQKIVTKVLQKAGFDRLVERGGIKQALSKSKYDAAAILGKIVYYFIFLAVLSAAFAVFGKDNPVSAFLGTIIAYLPRLFVAVLVLVIAFAVASAVKDLLSNTLGGLSYGATLAKVASLVIITIGVFFALGQLNIAPLIVGGVFYAVLALIVVPPIIAFGVGGIEPARQAITNMQSKAQSKAQEIKQEASSADEPTGELPATSTMPASVPVRTRAPRRPRPTP